jgi:hypothetical protein
MNKNGQARRSRRNLRWRFHLREFILASLVFLVCLCSSILGGLLEIRVPQPTWLFWPGCAILVTVLVLVPQEEWLLVITAGLSGFVVTICEPA